jgi:UDP-2-acetamido-3-amino-2,3-dideoxy-glucuronate N-acetyltransferase
MIGEGTKDYFVHPQGLCETSSVGSGTKIWAFAHILPGAVVGRECNICDGVFVESDVVIGDQTTIKSGVQLWDGVRLGNRVFIGPNATFTNDIFPRSKRYLASYPKTVVRDGASVGANATIMPGIQIGEGAMIGAGTVVLSDVPARAVIAGNPGRVVGYAESQAVNHENLPEDFSVKSIQVAVKADSRGRLVAFEFADMPFMPQRMFAIDLVKSHGGRGGHAHRECAQIIGASAGAVTCALDDGTQAYEVLLEDPSRALFVPAGVWVLLFGFTQNAVATVLASHPYSVTDYINDYSEFRRQRSSRSD